MPPVFQALKRLKEVRDGGLQLGRIIGFPPSPPFRSGYLTAHPFPAFGNRCILGRLSGRVSRVRGFRLRWAPHEV